MTEGPPITHPPNSQSQRTSAGGWPPYPTPQPIPGLKEPLLGVGQLLGPGGEQKEVVVCLSCEVSSPGSVSGQAHVCINSTS